MEKNTLTFSNTGFVYDLSNPTQQTEELSFILKNALLATTPINIRQETDQEYADREARDLVRHDAIVLACEDIPSALNTIWQYLDGISATLSTLGTGDYWLQSILQNIHSVLSELTAYLLGAEEDSDNLLTAINTVAASAGIFLDAPGLSIIDKPELI